MLLYDLLAFNIVHMRYCTTVKFNPYYEVICHRDITRPGFTDGGDGLQIWKVDVNIWSK